ncbi:MAG: pseudouridine synthase [Cyclobacteriaceae bacterium]
MKRPNKKAPPPTSSETRLNKFIANAGICSRRDADNLIAAGQVTVNGKVVKEMGFKVKKTDKVVYKGQALKSQTHQYVLLNKPRGFITTTNDPQERKTVMSLVDKACNERIYPVGRLDRDTSGLLLFTNDGETAKKLTHPSHKVKKIYQVELDKPITEDDFNKVLTGLKLEDGPAPVRELAVIGEDSSVLGIEIHIGRNRIVRRIFEHLGYKVKKLDRVMFGSLTKKNLPRGKFRHLNPKEIMAIKGVK